MSSFSSPATAAYDRPVAAPSKAAARPVLRRPATKKPRAPSPIRQPTIIVGTGSAGWAAPPAGVETVRNRDQADGEGAGPGELVAPRPAVLQELAKDQGEDGAADQQRLDKRKRSVPQRQGVRSEAADIGYGTGDPQRVTERPRDEADQKLVTLALGFAHQPSTSVLERRGNPEQGCGR